jgi:hypothetical protein
MTFYLRTDGSNANDGESELTAMQTFNALMLRLYREWDFQGYAVTIDIGEGLWAGESWTIDGNSLVGVPSGLWNWVSLTLTGKGRDKSILCPSSSTVAGQGEARIGLNLKAVGINLKGL